LWHTVSHRFPLYAFAVVLKAEEDNPQSDFLRVVKIHNIAFRSASTFQHIDNSSGPQRKVIL